jgi:hypothetical protein
MTMEVQRVNCATGDEESYSLTVEQEEEWRAYVPEDIEQIKGQQRGELARVQAANMLETDWIMNPPPDTDQGTLTQIENNIDGWTTFRQVLRALPILVIDDPTQINWPPHPIRPVCAMTPPPDFLVESN